MRATSQKPAREQQAYVSEILVVCCLPEDHGLREGLGLRLSHNCRPIFAMTRGATFEADSGPTVDIRWKPVTAVCIYVSVVEEVREVRWAG